MSPHHQSACARVAVLVAKNRFDAEKQLPLLSEIADIIELRLDYWSEYFIDEIARLRSQLTLPVIFTLRKFSQGGHCHWPEAERLNFIEKLAQLKPEYIDFEYDIPTLWLQNFRRQFPQITLIGSYHDFNGTPEDFMESVKPLLKPEFDIIKLAYMAHHVRDALRLLIFIHHFSLQRAVIGIAMGEAGQISRIVAPIIGSVMTYGTIYEGSNPAPGQISLQDLTHIYRVHHLNRHSRIYALLGDPIEQSPGHKFHNRAFHLLKKNAVYVKCRIPALELEECFILIKKLPFYGMSVTIPHKETLAIFLDELFGIASKINIVNTVKREQQKYDGFNTDALATIDVLEKQTSLINKAVLILGAGGAAKAIAYALRHAGAKITLCNRTLSRAQEFTQQFGGTALDFSQLHSATVLPYSIVINTLPGSAYIQQCGGWQFPPSNSKIAMDIVLKPLETAFLAAARVSGWICLQGDSFYKAQAVRQLRLWFELDEKASFSLFHLYPCG